MDRNRAIEDLGRRLPGRVGLAGSAVFEAARRVFCVAARGRRPLAAVRPRNRDEVAAVLAWATGCGMPVSPRSGGHSFDGFSVQDDLVVLDLRGLGKVSLDGERLLAMPGATNLDVAEAIGSGDRAVPLGDCPTVALGGLIAGGGFGNCSRLLGLTCDNLVEAKLVRPDGTILQVSAGSEPDLFWACRGGGGTVGVVTDMVFQTRHVPAMTSVTLTWRWSHVREGFALYRELGNKAPLGTDLKFKIRTTGADRFIDTSIAGPPDADPGVPLVHIDGDHIGPRDEALALLQPFLSHPGLVRSDIQARSFHDAEVALIPVGTLADPAPATVRPLRVASDFVSDTPEGAAVEAIVAFAEALQTAPDLRGGGIIIEPADGRVASPESDCAFANRDAKLLMQWELFYDLPLSADTVARQDRLLAELRDGIAPIATGGRYLNYADRLDTPEHWWRGNLERLRKVAGAANADGILVSRLTPPAA